MHKYHLPFAIAATGMLAFAGPSGAATYFVQDRISSNNPLLTLRGGLEEDGQTNKSTSYVNGTTLIKTNAKLGEGTLHGQLQSNEIGAIHGMTATFGDRVTITGGAGTNVDFKLSYNIAVDATTDLANPAASMLLTGSTRFAVFDPAIGASAGNWKSLAFPIFGGPERTLGKDLASFGYGPGDLPISDVLSGTLSFTLPVTSDTQSFDFFADLTTTIIAGNNTMIDLDLEVDGFASLGLADGVTITSGSGAFLTQGANAAPQALTPVPLPASATLLLGALGLLGWGSRRRLRSL